MSRARRPSLPVSTETLGESVAACVAYARAHYAKFTDAMESDLNDQIAFCGGITRGSTRQFSSMLPNSRKSVTFAFSRRDSGRYEPMCYSL